MDKDLKIKITLDNQTKELKAIRSDIDGFKNQVGAADAATNSFQERLKLMGHIGGGIFALKQAFDALDGTIGKIARSGIEFNRSMENSIAGLTALTVATSSNTSSLGRTLTLQEKYTLAQKEATVTAKELAAINAETPHTLDQTNQIYRSMYVSMKNAGASSADMIELTKKISIAAGAAGIEFNALLAGVDGLATGTVESASEMGRFLSSLGLTNEALKNSSNVVELLKSKFADFKAVETFDVAVSNATNAWQQFSGELMKDVFEEARYGINSISSALNGMTEKIRDLKLAYANPDEIKAYDDYFKKMGMLGDEWERLNKKYEEGGWFKDAYLVQRRDVEGQINMLRDAFKFSWKSDEALVAKPKEISQNEINEWQKYFDAPLVALENSEQAMADAIAKRDAEIQRAISSYSMPSIGIVYSAEEVSTLTQALELIESPIEKINRQFTQMHDVMLKVFDGNVPVAFYEKWQDAADKAANAPKVEIVDAKDQQRVVEGVYDSLSSTISSFYDEDDARKKKQMELDKAMHLVKSTMQVAEMVQSEAFTSLFLSQEAAKAQAAGATAVAVAAQSSPWTGFATAAAMIGLLASIGISLSGGGSGGGSSYVNPYEIKLQELEDSTQPMLERMDKQISLLERIEKNGSASQAGLDKALGEFTYEIQKKALEVAKKYGSGVFDSSDFGQFQLDAYTMPSFKTIADKIKEATGLEGVWYSNKNGDRDLYYSFSALLDTPDELLKYFANRETIERIVDENLARVWNMAQIDIMNDAAFKANLDSIQTIIYDFANNIGDSVDDMLDMRDTFEDIYDSYTGTTKYASLRLKEAQAEVDRLLEEADQPLSVYLETQIKNIRDLEEKYSLGIQELLLSTDPALIEEQAQAVLELKEATDNAFEGGAKEALNYLESIELVTQSMIDTRETIDSLIEFADSLASASSGVAKSASSVEMLFDAIEGFDAEVDKNAAADMIKEYATNSVEYFKLNAQNASEYRFQSAVVANAIRTLGDTSGASTLDTLENALKEQTRLDVANFSTFLGQESALVGAVNNIEYNQISGSIRELKKELVLLRKENRELQERIARNTQPARWA